MRLSTQFPTLALAGNSVQESRSSCNTNFRRNSSHCSKNQWCRLFHSTLWISV